ncbi:MAG: NmrA family NAD(P)-binding protein [Chitinophagaceae bacterium]
MNTTKTIFVTGGTGNQGGDVAKNLLQNDFKVKVLTRNPVSPFLVCSKSEHKGE